MCQEALDMERSHGEEGVEGKSKKDKGHDLWYKPEPLVEFRRIPMRCLYHLMLVRIADNGKSLT